MKRDRLNKLSETCQYAVQVLAFLLYSKKEPIIFNSLVLCFIEFYYSIVSKGMCNKGIQTNPTKLEEKLFKIQYKQQNQ